MAAKAKAAAPADAPAKPSLVATLVAGLLALLVAAGAGGGHGAFIAPPPREGGEAKAKAEPAAAPASAMKDLPAVVANLGVPSDHWVRLEASFALEPALAKEADMLARQIADDLVAYLRTARLEEINTPEGFAEFRREIDERAATRTGGKVKRLYVQTMVVQ